LRANFVSIIGGVFIGGLGILALITGSQQMALQEKLVDTKKQEVLDLEKIIQQKSQEIQQKSQEIQQKSQEITKQQKNIDEKKKAYDDLQKSYAELVKTKNELAKALNRPKLETQGIVYIQFQGSLERNSMKQLGTCVGIISQPENRSVEESDRPDGILSKCKSLSCGGARRLSPYLG